MSMQTPVLSVDVPAVAAVPEQRKGMAIAAMVVGIVATVLGLVPLFGLFALAGGIVALVLGLVAASKAKKAKQPRGMARAGWILGAVAIALGVIGMAVVNSAINDLERDLDQIEQELDA
jgi:hypothetical protein